MRCGILQCGARKNKLHPKLTLHKLPSNKSLKKKWLEIIVPENINPGIKNLFVCSLHFVEASFNRTLNVVRLHDGAVPSILPPEMDASDTILESTNGNVKIIRFNKPKRKNAIDSTMFARVTQILNEAAKDQNIFMVVLTGTGDFYTSGNDLTAVQHEEINKFIKVLSDFIEAFILFPKLLTAIVNGPAVGIGTTMLPLCDFVFTSDKAYFYAPFTKLGIIPEGCSTVTFPRLIGARKATELLLLNYKMPAQEALECGLINYLFKSDELEEKAWNKIHEILSLPIESFLVTKRLFRRPHLDELIKVNEVELTEVKRIKSKL